MEVIRIKVCYCFEMVLRYVRYVLMSDYLLLFGVILVGFGIYIEWFC